MEFTLLFAAATALAAMWIANRMARPDVEKPTDLLIGAAAVGLFVGRLAAMVIDGVNPITNPGDIIIVRAGVDTGFATVGALAALAWATRAGLPRVSDLLAPAAVAGLAGWHAGCVWRDACLGTVSEPSSFVLPSPAVRSGGTAQALAWACSWPFGLSRLAGRCLLSPNRRQRCHHPPDRLTTPAVRSPTAEA